MPLAQPSMCSPLGLRRRKSLKDKFLLAFVRISTLASRRSRYPSSSVRALAAGSREPRGSFDIAQSKSRSSSSRSGPLELRRALAGFCTFSGGFDSPGKSSSNKLRECAARSRSLRFSALSVEFDARCCTEPDLRAVHADNEDCGRGSLFSSINVVQQTLG
jgi:hypothetical protein